jgi:hypothetical protein
MCYRREYDQELQRKYDFCGRFPGDMSEKELFDLKLWRTIRHYEEVLKHKIRLQELSNENPQNNLD